MRRTLTTIAILAALSPLIAACETETADDPGESGAEGARTLRLSITSPGGHKTARRPSIRVAGRVTRGASVRVNGRRASVSGRRFRSRQSLDVGRNRIRVVARKDGYETKRRTVTVTRKRKPRPAPVATPEPTPTPTPTPTPQPSCHPGYEGGCLDPNSYDYDCEGGSGDGPDYTGTIRVVGDDPYDLDRDGDGIACDA